jgi:NADP-dependent 3-hydroxy acid dehydrogenase YdfG
MNVEIKNKVVVITGASSGIGEAMALLLAENGAKVVVGARRKEQLEELVARIKNAGGEAAYAVTDVTSRTDMVNLVQLACDQFGRLDVLINNAGVSQLSRMKGFPSFFTRTC